MTRRNSLVIAAILLLAACDAMPPTGAPGGDPRAGQELIRLYGCPACHTISGVTGATRTVGPPLGGIAQRSYIAGVLTNTPENLLRWIRRPQEVDPLTAMPDMGVTEAHARDIVAYLYARD